MLAPIKDSMLARDYAVQIATSVRAREQDVIDQLARLKPPRAEDDGPAEERSDGPAADPRSVAEAGADLPRAELNRLRFERELLSLAAQRPDLALRHADALAQTQWHGRAHALVAQSLLDTLAENPAAPAALVVTRAAQALPAAASHLDLGIHDRCGRARYIGGLPCGGACHRRCRRCCSRAEGPARRSCA
ncbi:hypothetical protein [Enteroscipio rubneri]|uniref:hypothetical protein n=1 Tax=Enteroscipio rubneri TaxID=2070686 RepID=UPI00320B638D